MILAALKNARMKQNRPAMSWLTGGALSSLLLLLSMPLHSGDARTVINLHGEWLWTGAPEASQPESADVSGAKIEEAKNDAGQIGGMAAAGGLKLDDETMAGHRNEAEKLAGTTSQMPDQERVQPFAADKVFNCKAAPVPDGTWKTMNVPGKADVGMSTAWLAKSFKLESVEGRRFFLQMDNAVAAARVFVNGNDFGAYVGSWAPVRVDVTKAVKKGDNWLQLGMRTNGGKGSLCPPPWGPGILPWSCFFDSHGLKSIGLWQRIQIEALPELHISDVFVKPSVENMTLGVRVELTNGGSKDKNGELMLAACLEDPPGSKMPGRIAHEFPAKPFSIKAGEKIKIEIAEKWADAELWWPHKPALYVLRVGLKEVPAADGRIDQNNGRPADSTNLRFGFREVSIKGADLLLNGKKMLMMGISHTSYASIVKNIEEARTLIEYYKATSNGNAIRMHIDPCDQFTLDACDEKGMLVLQQSSLAAWAGEVKSDVSWASWTDMWLRYVNLAKNHPCIMVWAVANEGSFMGGVPRGTSPSVPFLQKMIEATRKADGTRPVTSSHDFYIPGNNDVLDAPHGWSFEIDPAFPRCARQWWSYYWNIKDVYKKDKPWFNDEWNEGFDMNTASVIMGDKAYIHRDLGAGAAVNRDMRSFYSRMGQAWSGFMGLIEQRRQPYFGLIMPFGDRFSFYDDPTGPGVIGKSSISGQALERMDKLKDRANKAMAPAIIAPKEWNGGAFAGEAYKRHFTVMNNNFYPIRGRIRWKVTEGDKWLSAGDIPYSVDAASQQDGVLEFTMPRADTPRTWQLSWELLDENGLKRYEDTMDIGVMPRPEWPQSANIVIWPRTKSLDEIIKTKTPLNPALSSSLPDKKTPQTIVIVPRDAELTPDECKDLENYIFSGGRALILAEKIPLPRFCGTELKFIEQPVVAAHRRTSYLANDIPDASLRYWVGANGDFFSPPINADRPDFVIATNSPLRPLSGNCTPVLLASLGEHSADKGLALSPMLDVEYGGGRLIVCSLLLGEGVRTDEPAAVCLFARAIDYLKNTMGPKFFRPNFPPSKVFAVGFGPVSSIDIPDLGKTDCIDLWGAWRWAPKNDSNGQACGLLRKPMFIAAASKPENAGILLINGNSQDGRSFIESAGGTAGVSWPDLVKKGKFILFHDLNADQIAAVAKAAQVKLDTTTYDSNDKKAFLPSRLDWKEMPSGLFKTVRQGLSTYEVNWNETTSLNRLCVPPQQIVRNAVSSDNAEIVFADPGAIAGTGIGSGRILIDQVLWSSPSFNSLYIEKRARTYISQILYNIGAIQLSGPVSVPKDAPVPDEKTRLLFHFEPDLSRSIYNLGTLPVELNAVGDVSHAPGKIGQALRLGSPSAAAIGSPKINVLTPKYTMDFWIRPDEGCTGGIICAHMRTDKGRNNENTYGYGDNVWSLTKNLKLNVHTAGRTLTGKTPLKTSDWTRVTFTFCRGGGKDEAENTGIGRIYINGELDAEGTLNYHPYGFFSVGDPANEWQGGKKSGTFLGAIDELRVLSDIEKF